jgi:hypothetical protein
MLTISFHIRRRFGSLRIQAAIATVDADMLKRPRMESEYHLDIVRATNDAHVEYM